MKRFVKNLIIFGLLILVSFAGLEWYAESLTNDIVSRKKMLIDRQAGQIETLFVGSSETFRGVDPNLWPNKAFNLAFNGFDFDHNNGLIDATIDELPRLQTLFIEVPYFVFRTKVVKRNEYMWDWVRPTIYFHTKKFSRFSIYGAEVLHPSLLRDKIIPYSNLDFSKCDSTGHADNFPYAPNAHTWDDFAQMLANSQTPGNDEYYQENRALLRNMLVMCKERGVEAVLFSPPVSAAHYNALDSVQLAEIFTSIDELQKEFGFRYFCYMADSRFDDDDFVDPVHLSTDRGADKFTRSLLYDYRVDSAQTIIHK